MIKWIRWPGLLAFVILFAAVMAFTYLFAASSLLKNVIEDQGTDALGAKVELERVGLSLSPLGFSLSGFQAANPKAPMTNIFSFDSATMEIAFWQLLMSKFIINDLSIEGLAFNTVRETSGEITKAEKEKKAAEKAAAEKEPSLAKDIKKELPTADEIMSRETLLTEVRSQELKTLYADQDEKLEALKAKLPNSEQYKNYQIEIKQLSEGKLKSVEDFNQRKKRLDEIKRAIKEDKKTVSAAKDAYSTAYKEISAKLKQVKASPSEDLANLKSKYSLDGGGAANLTQLLFGGQTGSWTRQALYWYEKAKPFMESSDEEEKVKVVRKKGRYIYFGPATPEFLLKKAGIDVTFAGGHLTGDVRDVTHQPEILGRPATMNFKGDQLKGYESIDIKGEFNHVKADNSFNKIDLLIKSMEIKDFSVSKDSNFPLLLEKAKANVTGDLLLKDGEMKLLLDSDYRNAEFSTSATSGKAKTIVSLLKEINTFNFQLEAEGKIRKPKISMDSSLDKQLKLALKGKVKAKQKELEEKLKVKLTELVRANTGKYGDDLAKISQQEGGLKSKLNELNNLLSSKLTDFKEQQKQEAKAKQKEEEERAKQKAKDELKDKLKSFKF